MKELLNSIIEFITSKRVKKFFAREFLILLLGTTIFFGYDIFYTQPAVNNVPEVEKRCYLFEETEYYEPCIKNREEYYETRRNLFDKQNYLGGVLLIILYGMRILYQFFRFIGWCFRIVFFDK